MGVVAVLQNLKAQGYVAGCGHPAGGDNAISTEWCQSAIPRIGINPCSRNGVLDKCNTRGGFDERGASDPATGLEVGARSRHSAPPLDPAKRTNKAGPRWGGVPRIASPSGAVGRSAIAPSDDHVGPATTAAQGRCIHQTCLPTQGLRSSTEGAIREAKPPPTRSGQVRVCFAPTHASLLSKHCAATPCVRRCLSNFEGLASSGQPVAWRDHTPNRATGACVSHASATRLA